MTKAITNRNEKFGNTFLKTLENNDELTEKDNEFSTFFSIQMQ